MTRPFYTLAYDDVGKNSIHAFGRLWPVTQFIGRIMAQDVGKRVYAVNGILQVENGQQRSARLYKLSRETLQPRARDLFDTIVNEGSTYQRRLGIARCENARVAAGEWLAITTEAAREYTRKFLPSEPFTVSDLFDTAHALSIYYEAHIREMGA